LKGKEATSQKRPSKFSEGSVTPVAIPFRKAYAKIPYCNDI
jgi:hypothetical protein